MKKNEIQHQVAAAVAACEEKKADRLSILELEKSSGAFTDYFVICSGSNPRQIQAISDAVEDGLDKLGIRPKSVEGYKQAEWVLLDFVDFVVHVFSDKAREYYDLERLWKSAKRMTSAELMKIRERVTAPAKAAKKTARKSAKAPAKTTAAKKTVRKKAPAKTAAAKRTRKS